MKETAYESGIRFYTSTLGELSGKLKEVTPSNFVESKQNNIYDRLEVIEQIEIARLKLSQLERRKRWGLIR